MREPTDNMRLYFEADGSPRRWTVCSHKWVQFFGPALRCQHCGAGTMLCLGDPKEQPIDAPLSVLMESRN